MSYTNNNNDDTNKANPVARSSRGRECTGGGAAQAARRVRRRSHLGLNYDDK